MTSRLLCSLIVTACCAVASARAVQAQETINFASVSGRVTDAQGAVVPGARVSARQIDTNITSETVTQSDGRFRFPYLKIGAYELKVQMSGFTDSTRMLTATLGSAFDIPVVLAVAGLETTITVSGESTVLEAARSQIAGTLPQLKFRACP